MLLGHSARPLGEYGLASCFAGASGSSLTYLELLPSIFHSGVKQTECGVVALHYLTDFNLLLLWVRQLSHTRKGCNIVNALMIVFGALYLNLSASFFSALPYDDAPWATNSMSTCATNTMTYLSIFPPWLQPSQTVFRFELPTCFGELWHKNLLHSQLFVQRSVHQHKYHRHPPKQVSPQKT